MEFSYKTKGVCSRAIHIVEENGIVKSVKFDGGCSGNTQGSGIKCGFKNTSCPDQLAKALEEYKNRKG